MCLLGDEIDKVRDFQARVVGLAMEAEMWTVRCRVVHPGGTTGESQGKTAADEYASEIQRTKRKAMPVSILAYKGLPFQNRRALLGEWLIAFSPQAETLLDSYFTRTPRPAPPRGRRNSRRGGLRKRNTA